MAGGLLDLNDPSDQWNIDPTTLAAMASAAGAPSWTPSDAAPADVTLAATDAQPAPAAPAAPPATMADTGGGGFWHGLTSGIGDVGLALGGGIDPSITGEAAGVAGRRALLNFSLAMLANSGPSYTPRNFGQILASGLDAAGQSTLNTEQNRLKAQQVAATYALKAGQQKIQEYLAGIKAAEAGHKLGVAGAVSAAAGGGGGGTAPAAGDTGPPGAAPASAADFVAQNAATFGDIAAKTGFPVDFIAGQAGNESGWGTSRAAVEGNNLFGLSDANGKPLSFPTRQAGIDAYVNLVNTRYKDVPRTGSPTDIGVALGKAGYNMTVPDYGTRIGNFAAQAAPLLARPAGTQVAGPGAGAGGPSGGAAPPAPSSPVPSPGTGVVGPPATEPPATVNAAPPTAPLIPRATLAPPDFSDIPGRRAAVEAAYRAQLANVANSGDPNLRATAEQERRTGLAAVDKEVADRKAAYAKEAAEFEQKQNEAEAKLREENARAAATITAQNAREAAERQNKLDVEAAKAKAAIDTAHATNIGHIMAKRLETSGTDAQAARDLGTKVDQLELVAPVIMQGGPSFVADKSDDVRNFLRFIGAGTDSQWATWNAQDTWKQTMKQLQVGANAAFKGSVSDYEERIAGASFQTLAQDPQNIPIALGMLRAAINRKQVIDGLRNDYASSPEGKANGTAGMEAYVNSHLPGFDPKNPLTPPPLFAQPPPLKSAVLPSGASAADVAAARAADTTAQNDYANAPDKANGIPFQVWQTIKGADGKDQRVKGWAVKGPDGRWHTQAFARGG